MCMLCVHRREQKGHCLVFASTMCFDCNLLYSTHCKAAAAYQGVQQPISRLCTAWGSRIDDLCSFDSEKCQHVASRACCQARRQTLDVWFSGRDMRSRVLELLQSRPWLFTVTPHGEISVTRLAREGLVYKRDVITYMYTALQDGASFVTVTELAELVQQPPGITEFMLVGCSLCAKQSAEACTLSCNTALA